MRLTLRLLGAIWISALIIIAAFAVVEVREERQRIVRDLERRATLLGEGLKESVEPAMRKGRAAVVLRLLKKFGRPDRHIVAYDSFASPVASAPEPPSTPPLPVPEVTEAIGRDEVVKGL